MNTTWYDNLPDSSDNIFYFVSSGDTKIDKVIVFTQMDDPDSYAVALGNLQVDGSIDVHGTGDNGDTAVVLSTVAKIIAFFLADHPGASVVVEGTTAARARLYQMAVVREVDDLGRYFDIYGFDGVIRRSFSPAKTIFLLLYR